MSRLLHLAVLNLGRRRLRSAVTAGGVALSVALLSCLLAFQAGYQNGLGRELDRLGAHLLVVPKGCPYDAASVALHGANWPCYLEQAYLETVRTTPHVATAAPVLMSATYDAATGAQTVYCGVEPDILRLKRGWHIAAGAFPVRAGELLIGAERAKTSGWEVGKEVNLPGLPGQRARICGVLAPTQGADDLFIFSTLADARVRFRRPNQLTHILVRCDDPERVDQVTHDLRGCEAGLEMNVVPLAHLFRTIQNLVSGTRALLAGVALVALLAAGAGVSNTFLMSVSERTGEIGMMRAVGISRAAVFGMMLSESLFLCLIGGGVGLVAAAVGGRSVEAWLRMRLPYAPPDTLITVGWQVGLLCLGGAVALGALAGFIPAVRAAQMSPVEAMRSGGAA